MIRPTKLLGAFAVMLLFASGGYLSAEETKGTIKSIDMEKKEIVLSGLIRNTLYEMDKDAKVCLDGVKSKLAELKEGDQAVIVYEKKGEHMIANEVRGLRTAQEASGTVRSTFTDKKEITLKGLVKDTTYELNKDATVWLNGKTAALTDIREGDQVLITFQQKGEHYMAARVRASRK